MRVQWTVCMTICMAVALGPAAAAPPTDAATRALEVYARGDYAKTVALLAPLHAAGKANIQQRLILARAQMHLDKADKALAVLRSVLETDRENPEANSLTGQLLLAGGKAKEALEPLEHAYRLQRDPVTAAALGRCYHKLGQTAKAKSHLQRAMAEDIRDPANSFLLGRICLERGLGASAQKYLLTAREAGMDSLELGVLLVRAYLLQRKFVGPVMVQRIDQPARGGQVVSGRLVLAAVGSKQGLYKVCTQYSALSEGLAILKRSPKNADALYAVARGWLAAGRADLAGAATKKLLAVEAKSKRTCQLRVQLLIASNDLAGLGKLLADKETVKLLGAERIGRAHYQSAMALRARGERASAIAALKKAEHHTPTSAKVLRSLATLCLATGKKADARVYYARMVELFPDAPDIDELRNALKALTQSTGGGK